jgi:hypothetical protein
MLIQRLRVLVSDFSGISVPNYFFIPIVRTVDDAAYQIPFAIMEVVPYTLFPHYFSPLALFNISPLIPTNRQRIARYFMLGAGG